MTWREQEVLGKEQLGVAVTEGGRRPTGVTAIPGAATPGEGQPVEHHDPEVSEKPIRRRFTAGYKQRILEEADRCTQRGTRSPVATRGSLLVRIPELGENNETKECSTG